jgi:hypothetical protein
MSTQLFDEDDTAPQVEPVDSLVNLQSRGIAPVINTIRTLEGRASRGDSDASLQLMSYTQDRINLPVSSLTNPHRPANAEELKLINDEAQRAIFASTLPFETKVDDGTRADAMFLIKAGTRQAIVDGDEEAADVNIIRLERLATGNDTNLKKEANTALAELSPMVTALKTKKPVDVPLPIPVVNAESEIMPKKKHKLRNTLLAAGGIVAAAAAIGLLVWGASKIKSNMSQQPETPDPLRTGQTDPTATAIQAATLTPTLTATEAATATLTPMPPTATLEPSPTANTITEPTPDPIDEGALDPSERAGEEIIPIDPAQDVLGKGPAGTISYVYTELTTKARQSLIKHYRDLQTGLGEIDPDVLQITGDTIQNTKLLQNDKPLEISWFSRDSYNIWLPISIDEATATKLLDDGYVLTPHCAHLNGDTISPIDEEHCKFYIKDGDPLPTWTYINGTRGVYELEGLNSSWIIATKYSDNGEILDRQVLGIQDFEVSGAREDEAPEPEQPTQEPPQQPTQEPGGGDNGGGENGGENNPGDDEPGNDPGDDEPGNDPGDDEPGNDPGDDEPGNDPGDQEPGNPPGDQEPGNDENYNANNLVSFKTRPHWEVITDRRGRQKRVFITN